MRKAFYRFGSWCEPSDGEELTGEERIALVPPELRRERALAALGVPREGGMVTLVVDSRQSGLGSSDATELYSVTVRARPVGGYQGECFIETTRQQSGLLVWRRADVREDGP